MFTNPRKERLYANEKVEKCAKRIVVHRSEVLDKAAKAKIFHVRIDKPGREDF